MAFSAPVLMLTGCMSNRPQQFAMSFLPAVPATPPAAAVEHQPPPPPPAAAPPEVIAAVAPEPPKPSAADLLIAKAQGYFESGQRLYRTADFTAARDQFNKSVDVLLAAPEDLKDRQKVEHKLDRLADAISRYDADGFGSDADDARVVYDKSPLDGMLQMTFPVDPKLKPKVMEEIQATASQLPLELNDSVLSYIHYFSTDRGRKTLIAGLKRAGRYKPLIQRILTEEGVPQELLYLAQAESGFLPRALSYKQATGMWQFVSWRGREYGLMQTRQYDDRLDPEKATRAAARHLRDLYTHFGDWYLAMAAYNCGPGCVDNAVQRTGYADFWELRSRNALPRETMNYVPLIVAITIMSKNPHDYGIDDVDADAPLEYDTVDLKCPTNIALVADALNVPVSEVRDMNPALLRSVAPAGYALHIAKGDSNMLMSALSNVPSEHRSTWRMHRVQRGETLAEVARAFSTPASSIAAANRSLVLEAPEEGDVLIIPASYNPDAPARAKAKHSRGSRRTATRSNASSHRTSRTASSRRSRAHNVADRILHHRAGTRTYRASAARVD